jgi:hypothetical protein
MPFTNSTPNYGLPQYIATDKPTYLGDANGAYAAIDTRMKANANAAAANQNSISLLSARVLANEGNIDARYTKTESDARYAGEPNQLDNANLLKPVNQRGANSYTGTGVYCIDRWKLWGSYNVVAHTLTYVSGNSVSHAGLNVCALVQRNTLFGEGETVTMSAKVNGTVYSQTITLQSTAASYPMGTFHFIAGVDTSAFFEIAIESSTVVIDWVKLESGSVATPYVPKGYGAELSECLRYYYQVDSVRTFGQQHTGAGTTVNIILPQIMRETPIVNAPGEWTVRFNSVDTKATVSSVSSLAGNVLSLSMSTVAGGTYIGPLYAFYDGKLAVSAEL